MSHFPAEAGVEGHVATESYTTASGRTTTRRVDPKKKRKEREVAAPEAVGATAAPQAVPTEAVGIVAG